jgi:hypothetical protein
MALNHGRSGALLFAFVLAAAGGLLWMRWDRHRDRTEARHFADGTRVYWRGAGSAVPTGGYPDPRLLTVNGDLLVVAPDGPAPLLIHTRLLNLTVFGNAEIRITAFSQDSGAQAQVLRGRVVASKAYRSGDSAQDTLGAGEMIMVNQTIDLMEKERDAADTTRHWADELLSLAARPR